MGTVFCTLDMMKCDIHASVGLRSLERDENIDRYKTSPWTQWRHLDFRAEVDVRHGLIPQYMPIDLYSDKSDQVFSALQHVRWVHLPKIASIIFANSPVRLGEDSLSFLRPAPQAPRNRNGLAHLNVVERANGASRDRSLPLHPGSRHPRGGKATHSVCVRHCSVKYAIRYCNE